jgi:hypothetical protein
MTADTPPRRLPEPTNRGALWLGAVTLVATGSRQPTTTASHRAQQRPSAMSPVPAEPGTASGHAAAECPPATVTVSTAGSLKAALGSAKPGDSIRMADGVYTGHFEASNPGTDGRPIFLCGGAGAVIDGGGVSRGYAFHLNGASHWSLVGFTVRNGQKGVMADKVQRVVIQKLTVEKIGDEAIHLRDFSTDNLVEGNTIRSTGLRQDKFGEGIYVGSAKSNWCTVSNCQPDNSDRNVLRGNHISATTAESIDIKEGTTGGLIAGNTFDGSGLVAASADSWLDVKGNGWTIEGNTGRTTPGDGYQTHEVVKGWGTNNVFKANLAEVSGPGWGFHLAPVSGNKVTCDNKVTGAAKGLANADCS